MIKTAKKYLNAQHKERAFLRDYYNANCLKYIEKSRKYKMKNGDSWCAMFTSVIAEMNGLSPDVFPYEVSVYYQMLKAKKMGLFYTDLGMVKPNDLIVYDWKNDGTVNHVGIVVSRENGFITAIEGNKHNTVAYRRINEHSPLIEGFINVNMGLDSTLSDLCYDNEEIETLVTRTLLGMFGHGLARKKALGVNFNEVQKRINRRA